MASGGAVRTRLTRAQSRARTRDLLIDSAMQVVARDGYAGASVDAIAAHAGFSMGAVYSNFATKEELFLAAFERHCAGELAALAALVDAHAGVDQLLTAVVDRFADLDEPHTFQPPAFARAVRRLIAAHTTTDAGGAADDCQLVARTRRAGLPGHD